MKVGLGCVKRWSQILALAFFSCLNLSELHYLTEQSANLSVKQQYYYLSYAVVLKIKYNTYIRGFIHVRNSFTMTGAQ